MYRYHFYSGGYESPRNSFLLHEEKYTDEQLQEICFEGIKDLCTILVEVGLDILEEQVYDVPFEKSYLSNTSSSL